MTGNFHVSQSLLQKVLKTQKLSWVQPLLASLYSGAFHPTAEGHQVFPCQSGHLILAVANDSQFRSFCRAVGKPEWAADERFAVGAGRAVNRHALIAMIAELMLERSMQDWMTLLEAANVPCGPINTLDKVYEDPQVQHRGMKVELQHPAGPISLLASPLRFSGTPVNYEVPPPLLGQHTESVMHELLGMNAQQVHALREQGVL
jgi:crotonobetainyl-CoA:carnitine CoA-transferase CaiB-like acyl-CoA transferase